MKISNLKFTSTLMHQELSELRTLLEDRGFNAIKSGAKTPAVLIRDTLGRQWRPQGRLLSTPEVRMAMNVIPKKRGSIWVKYTFDSEPGLELNGEYEDIVKRASYKPIVQGKKFQLSYEESKRFIEECL